MIPDSHRDLLDAPVGILGTIGRSGRPQLSAVWFLAEGDTIKTSLNTSRQKVKNLRTNPAVNLFILDPAAPTRYLEVRGDAELVEQISTARRELFGLRFQHATGELDNTAALKDAKHEVARALTVARERGIDG